jgi:hypothetical protein
LGPESLQKAFVNNQANRNYVNIVMILGRSALVASSKFPQKEMELVREAFPSTSTFTNPQAEANKLVQLKGMLLARKRTNLKAITQGAVSSKESARILAKNFQIDMTLMMLGSTPLPSSVPVAGQRTTPSVPIGIGNGRPIIINPPANPPANAVDPEL